MLGYYHYGVVLTYLSLVSSVIGISMTLNGRHITLAIVCLMVSGCLDAFDGRVAQTRKNATDEEKSFGIQIDSLCDMVCFGVLPACIGFACGLNKWYHIAILALFVLAALIRLGYYNVMEMAQKNVDESGQRFFPGACPSPPSPSSCPSSTASCSMQSCCPGQASSCPSCSWRWASAT